MPNDTKMIRKNAAVSLCARSDAQPQGFRDRLVAVTEYVEGHAILRPRLILLDFAVLLLAFVGS
jgi:hypothetical protein